MTTPTKETFLIHCLTDTHVGRGDVSDGPVDKLIQRHPITGLPIMSASSLKGAFRDFAKINKSTKIEAIFGSEKSTSSSNQGKTNFFDATLLCLPLPSNKKQWYMATSPQQAQYILSWMETFGFTLSNNLKADLALIAKLEPSINKPIILEAEDSELLIHDFDSFSFQNSQSLMSSFWKNNMIVLHHDNFKEVCDDYNLPVIARNNLQENSENLWYEQFIPSETRFLTFAINNDEFCSVSEILDDKVIQIGANATVGQGFCKLTKES